MVSGDQDDFIQPVSIDVAEHEVFYPSRAVWQGRHRGKGERGVLPLELPELTAVGHDELRQAVTIHVAFKPPASHFPLAGQEAGRGTMPMRFSPVSATANTASDASFSMIRKSGPSRASLTGSTLCDLFVRMYSFGTGP